MNLMNPPYIQDNMDRTYWVARSKVTGQLEGGTRSATPHLYLGRKAAMAAKRINFIRSLDYSYRKETDEELLERYDFIEVRLWPADQKFLGDVE